MHVDRYHEKRLALAGGGFAGGAAAAIVRERAENGPYASIWDFAERVDSRLLNKRQIDALACAGAFDSLYPNRARIVAGVDVLGSHGRFTLQISSNGKLYSLADNIARQQFSEPFSQQVGVGVDTSTGSFGHQETDLALQGGPLPLVFTRYYRGHSDRYGELGARWTHTYDTFLGVYANGDVSVVFGSGKEEYFAWDSNAQIHKAVDVRVKSTLTTYTNPPDGVDYRMIGSSVTEDGWLRTGDLARRGPIGLVAFAGRKKDVIKHGGYSVFAAEVERALEENESVAEAAVLGLPDQRKGEVPVAVVRLHSGATATGDEIAAWAAEHMSDYKAPQRVVIVDDFPRTGTDKVLQDRLLGLFDES